MATFPRTTLVSPVAFYRIVYVCQLCDCVDLLGFRGSLGIPRNGISSPAFHHDGVCPVTNSGRSFALVDGQPLCSGCLQPPKSEGIGPTCQQIYCVPPFTASMIGFWPLLCSGPVVASVATGFFSFESGPAGKQLASNRRLLARHRANKSTMAALLLEQTLDNNFQRLSK